MSTDSPKGPEKAENPPVTPKKRVTKPRIELDDKDFGVVLTATRYGMSMEKVADLVKMSKDTLERRLKERPERIAALKKERHAAEYNVSKAAYDLAVGGKCPAMTMFYLKCRAGWKETSKIEHAGVDGRPIQFEEKRAFQKLLTSDEAIHAVEVLVAAFDKNETP